VANVDLADLRRQMVENPFPRDLQAARQAYENMALQFAVPSSVGRSSGSLGGRPCDWYGMDNRGAPNRIVLYFHGGGYSIGSLKTHAHIAAELSRQTGAAVALLDYRLAPEFSFPAAVNDALAASRELLDLFPAATIAFAGDSAGAGLAVATLVNLERCQLPQPACAYCMSPWVDMTCGGNTMTSRAAFDPLLSRDLLGMLADWYLSETDSREPLASPIYADLRGVAPLLIQVGSAEVLLDDAVGLARAAGNADVNVSLEIWPNMFHGWQAFFPVFETGRDALTRGATFVRNQMNMQAPGMAGRP
jgi:epsilon-lactone hydrolase